MTHNLWGTYRWPERQPALQAFLRLRMPDIYAVQELRPGTRKVIDAELVNHDRVDDGLEGWEQESNIWWDRRLFGYVAHGAVEFGTAYATSRPWRPWLYWVRLSSQGHAHQSSLVVSTAHFDWPGNRQEIVDHRNPRIAQSEAVLTILSEVAGADEPCLFMGDLNEAAHPLRVLRAGGLMDSFAALRMMPTPTCPVGPIRAGDPDASEPTRDFAPRVIDFQLHRGPVRPLLCEVVDFFEGDLAPSDHRPVATVYAFT